MKNLLLLAVLALSVASAATAAPALKSSRVPPAGITISEADRAELRAGADALAKEIAALRSSPLNALLPDIEIFHKAVDWPLRYDEFYRSNEVGLARTLLKDGMERARQLREGQPNWITATGLVVRGYVSKIDGSVQPYGLVVPATWATNRTRPRRLDVWLQGRDNHLTELKFIGDRQRSYGEFAPANTFVLHPYGRYCNAFKFAGEIDVFEAMEHVKKAYRIDERRLAVRGFSMGGAGAWHLATHYPDVWAVAAPGAGFAETAQYTKALSKEPKPSAWEQKLWQLYDATDYAANFFNLPVIAYDGSDDPQRQAADVMERAMKAEGLLLGRVQGLKVGHKYTPEAKKDLNNFVDGVMARGKYPAPRTVHFTTRTARYNQGPYVTIARLERHWERADVHVRIANDYSVTVRTTNVAELWLELPNRGVDNSQLTIDGQLVQRSGPGNSMAVVLFPRLSKDAQGRWTQIIEPVSKPSLAKVHGLQGPIDDAFMDSFLVVRPTGHSPDEKIGAWVTAEIARATNEWRGQFRGDARVKDDTQVTDADMAAHHLVLFGDPRSNRLLARIADKLPIQWSGGDVRVGNKTFTAASHVPVFIFPNPLNPRRYVVVNSGITFAAAGAGSNAQQTPKLPDFAVLDLEKNATPVFADFFDEQWKLR